MYIFYLSIFFFKLISIFTFIFSYSYIRFFSFLYLSIFFIIFIYLFFIFNKSIFWYQLILTSYVKLKFFNFYYVAGIDGISIFFIILSAFILLCCLVAYWFLKYRLYLYISLLLLSLWILFNLFTTLNFIYFYVFFEAIIIPMFLLIGVYGSRNRKIYATYAFFIYTLVGSIFILLCLLSIESYIGISSFNFFFKYFWTLDRLVIIWIFLFIGFAIKVPIVPLHIWLPEAHVEAPTPGSVILAAILLKLGPYAMIRLLLGLFFYVYNDVIFLILTIAVMSFFFSALVAFNQIDIKKIIAYSSVSHMNYSLLGLFSNSILGLLGVFYLLFGHALVSGALFFSIGVLYDRYKTRMIFYYSNLILYMPVFGIMMFIFILANFGFPLTANFVGEFLVLVGIFKFSFVFLIIILIGMTWNLIFSLFLFNILFFGDVKVTFIKFYCDVIRLEFLLLFILLLLTLLLGVYPSIIIDSSYLSLSKYLYIYS